MVYWALVLGQVVAAFIVVDIATGIYHWMTDKGYNFKHQVELFQDHHRTNTMEGFDWQPLVGSLPIFLLGCYFAQPFFIAAGLIGCFAQVPHYFAHRGTNSRVVKFLQWTGVMMSSDHHALHHNGDFDRHYCILSSWNNWWFNWLVTPRRKD